MSLLLSLETSTSVCSVALHANGSLLAQIELHEDQAHSRKLSGMIKHVLEVADKKIEDLDAVAVSSGPGSYTGLRIGISTAKGLCYASNIPLVAVNTLDIIAGEVNRNNPGRALCCPMIDARRMEVYCAILDSDNQYRTSIEAKVIDAFSFQDVLENSTILFCGNGALKCRGTITHPNAVFVDMVYPNAVTLGMLAYKKFQQNNFEDLVSFEPLYLKEFLVKKSLKAQ